MLQDFQNITLRSVDSPQILGALLVAFGCGLAISLVYRWTYRGASYAPSFVRSMIFLSMITALVMLVIGNNLARAFGLVGAMSIIRFRTAVKDPQDIVFIFFALAVGLAAGVGMYQVALVSTLVICLAILVTTKSNFAVISKESFLLQLTYNGVEHHEAAPYLDVLNRACKRHRLINVRTVGADDALELTYFVDLRDKRRQEALTRELSGITDVTNVNLFYDNEQL